MSFSGGGRELVRYLSAQSPSSLFKVLNKLPRFGVGRKVTRVCWNVEDKENHVNPPYWTITKVLPDQDLQSGKVWGVFCQRGRFEEKARSVQSSERKQWKLLPKDYSSTQ